MKNLATCTALSSIVFLSGCHDPRLLATAILGPSGGRIAGPGVALDLPAGALGKDVSISISIATETPKEYALVAPVFHFEPDGLQFDVPVRAELTTTTPGVFGALLWSRPGGQGGYDVVGLADH